METRTIIAWAIDNADLTLYRTCPGFEADENWNGSALGDNGGEIHLIAQNDTGCTYGETTEDIDAASYLVGDACIIAEGSARAAVGDLLDRLFGDQSTWPDNCAQTHGWKID